MWSVKYKHRHGDFPKHCFHFQNSQVYRGLTCIISCSVFVVPIYEVTTDIGFYSFSSSHTLM